MLQLIGEIFISIFFVFGLYCAALEIWRSVVRRIRHRKTPHEEIDISLQSSYNNDNTSITKQ